MPAERGYERQVTPQAAQARPLRSAASFGAGVGEVLARGGESIHRDQVRAYEIERRATADQEWARFVANRAQRSTDLHAQVTKMRAEYGPGHAGRVKQLLEAGREDQTSWITEESVLQRANAELAGDDARMLQSEGDFETVKSATVAVEDLKEAKGTLLGRLQLATDPAELKKLYAEAHGEWGAATGGITLIDEVTRARAGREFAAEALVVTATRMADMGETDEAEAMLRANAVALGLDAGDVERVQTTIGLSRRAQAQAAKEAALAVERAANEARDAVREQVRVLKIEAARRDLKPSEVAAVVSAGRAAGLPDSEVLAIAVLGEDSVEQAAIRTMAPRSLDAEAQRLDALRQAGKLDKAGERRQQIVEAELKQRDTGDGARIAEIFATDQNAALAKLRTIDDPARRFRVAEKAGKGLGAIAMLPGEAIDDALAGRGLLTTRRSEFLPPAPKGETSDASRERTLRAQFDLNLGALKTQLSGEAYGDKLETALAIMAASRNRAGRAGFHERDFAKALQIAFGATERRGGQMQGGFATIGRGTVILPDNYTSTEFDTALARADLAGATYDGTMPAAKADVRKHYLPVWDVTLGGYRFVDARGRSLRRKGAPDQLYAWLPKGAR